MYELLEINNDLSPVFRAAIFLADYLTNGPPEEASLRCLEFQADSVTEVCEISTSRFLLL